MNEPKNISKQLLFEILRAVILDFEGANPKYYGISKEICQIGRKLSEALNLRIEQLIQDYMRQGKLKEKWFGKDLGYCLDFANGEEKAQ